MMRPKQLQASHVAFFRLCFDLTSSFSDRNDLDDSRVTTHENINNGANATSRKESFATLEDVFCPPSCEPLHEDLPSLPWLS
ncbi:hypothetical protein GGR54DRAFT_465358 [Hypoxylon sp. NC1633]|nr:hypothetical protein GGR54DRAFT_465358 [Hypoxylon sp. NC1633]